MAGRLSSQGVDLILWNRSPEKAAYLGRELGLPVAKSLVALVKLDFSVPYPAFSNYQKLFRQVHP